MNLIQELNKKLTVIIEEFNIRQEKRTLDLIERISNDIDRMEKMLK